MFNTYVKAQNVTSDLEKYQIKKDSVQLQTKQLKMIIYIILALDEQLPKKSSTFYFNAEKNESPNRFEATIKQNKILNLTNLTVKKKMKINNNKVQKVRLQRDLFGRMLAISMNANTNIDKIFTFPLIPVLIIRCKKRSSNTHRHLFDRRLLSNLLYERRIKNQIVTSNNKAREIQLNFERYFAPPIKNYERSL
ncbi:hypothetical protein TSAR_012166 [Trichomalopsis sarcophagae]|uniref:Uncharacterized protein n=1 Tax=Trichomalopsis sarcophagae TaxID=543379 RepID=A0A232FKK5_9HYME|nr:hypothetical protein TSAR_012166 [Trichomalopsis sarcophagae]